MRLLLDTHAFIWWDSDPNRLSQRVLGLCRSPSTTLLLSVASVWEIQIKQQLGKLRLHLPLASLIAAQQQTNGLELLPVQLDHVLGCVDISRFSGTFAARRLMRCQHTNCETISG